MSKRKKRQIARPSDELSSIIREAQQQPGIADLMILMEQSAELENWARESREATVVTKIVSASATS